jgi:hypothetical protein
LEHAEGGDFAAQVLENSLWVLPRVTANVIEGMAQCPLLAQSG